MDSHINDKVRRLALDGPGPLDDASASTSVPPSAPALSDPVKSCDINGSEEHDPGPELQPPTQLHSTVNGTAQDLPRLPSSNKQARRISGVLRQSHPHLTEAARDPRDEAPHLTPNTGRSVSPYTHVAPIDFDGLSWPSEFAS